MTLKDLQNLNMDKIKLNFSDSDIFNDYLFVFRKKILFIKKHGRFFQLCSNYPMQDYEYLDSYFYICRVSTDSSKIVNMFIEEIHNLTLEVVPF